MNIKGLDQVRKHIPDLHTPLGVVRFFLLSICLVILVTAFFTTQSFAWPFWQLGGEIAFGGLGFLMVYLFFRNKKKYKARYGPLAYNEAGSRFAFPGVAIIFTVVAHIRSIPGPEIQSSWWDSILPALGWVLIAVGALLFLRTVLIFGVDNLAMLYVYFPEESRLVNHRIYSIVRHPAYAAAQYVAFGLALLNGNWFALACAFMLALALWCWVRLVEEKELIERFGPGYVEYRQRVPAFYPRLRDLRGFLEFLIAGRTFS